MAATLVGLVPRSFDEGGALVCDFFVADLIFEFGFFLFGIERPTITQALWVRAVAAIKPL